MPVALNHAADMKLANPIKGTTLSTSKTEATVPNVKQSETLATEPVAPSKVPTHPTIEEKPTIVPDKSDSMVTTAKALLRPAINIQDSGLMSRIAKLAPTSSKPPTTHSNQSNTEKNLNSEEDVASTDQKSDKEVNIKENTSDNESNAPERSQIAKLKLIADQKLKNLALYKSKTDK